MALGETLKRLRKDRGWTQEELAAKLSVSRQALSKWEVGASVPDLDTVLQLCRVFGVTPNDLLTEKTAQNPSGAAGRKMERELPNCGKIRVCAGLLTAGISAAGMLVLGILSSVRPAYYAITPADEEWVRVYTGLAGFLKTHRLEWLFALCLVSLFGGIAAVCYPRLRILCKQRWFGKISGRNS